MRENNSGFLSNFLSGLIANLLSSIVIFTCLVIYYDHIKNPPLNINGKWKFTMNYEQTGWNPYKGMQVIYEVVLIQHERKIKGYGQKYSTQTRNQQSAHEHTGSERVEIEIEGVVHEGIFAEDRINLFYYEKGGARSSATFHELVRLDSEKMVGQFESTIANSAGAVSWGKVIKSSY